MQSTLPAPDFQPIRHPTSSAELPHVTAVMVTGKSAERLPLARLTAAAFCQQTYGSRELLIVNTNVERVEAPGPGIRELHLPDSSYTLGELRNIGLGEAAGEWIVQWDDDDWHHPRRIEEQMKMAERDAACVLNRQIRLHLEARKGFVYYDPQGIHGTILHHRRIPWRYPSKGKAEDTEFLHQFARRIVADNVASLYVRFYHGHNTWDESHIMRSSGGSVQSSVLPELYRDLCETLLREFAQAMGLTSLP